MRVFLDSSMLVEKAKGRKQKLFDYLTANIDYELCISQIVLSEYTFYLLIIEGGKAPLTLKRDGVITTIIEQHNPAGFLDTLTFLEADAAIIPLYLRLMKDYNLLPNDALILATCKLHRVEQIASFDDDFAPACTGEGIRLIRSVEDLRNGDAS